MTWLLYSLAAYGAINLIELVARAALRWRA
jgi:hypothetical protein